MLITLVIGVFACCMLALIIGSLVGLIALFVCSVPPTAMISAILSTTGIRCGFLSRLHLTIWWFSYLVVACVLIYLHVHSPYSISAAAVLQISWVQIVVKTMYSIGVLSIPRYFLWMLWRADKNQEGK